MTFSFIQAGKRVAVGGDLVPFEIGGIVARIVAVRVGRMRAAGHDRDGVDGPVRQDGQIGVQTVEIVDHLLDRHHDALGRQRRFLLDADDAFDQHVAFPVGLLRMDEGDVGPERGNGRQFLAGERAGDRFDVRIDRGQLGAPVAAEHRAGQAGGARLIGLGHAGMAVFLDLDRARKAVLDGVAHAAQQADAGIAGIGEDHFLREAHADHLVVDDVGRHADQASGREIPGGSPHAPRRRDQMGEALEGDDVAIIQVLGNGLFERQEFDHRKNSGVQKVRIANIRSLACKAKADGYNDGILQILLQLTSAPALAIEQD